MLISKPPCWDKTTECALASVCVWSCFWGNFGCWLPKKCDSPSTALTRSCSSLSRSSWSSLSSSFRCSASRTCLSRSSSLCFSTSIVARVWFAQMQKLNYNLHHIYKQESTDTHLKKKPTPFSLVPCCSVWLLCSSGGFSSFCFISFSWGRKKKLSVVVTNICGCQVGHLGGYWPLPNIPFV